MREETTAELRVLAAYRGGEFGSKELAAGEVSEATVAKIRGGEKSDHRALARLGVMYREARKANPAAAAEWVAGILAAAGIDDVALVRLPMVAGTAEAEREVQEAAVASSHVLAEQLQGAPVEERLRDARVAVREAVEAEVALEKLVPQRTLRGVA